jgi:hypothetical protein
VRDGEPPGAGSRGGAAETRARDITVSAAWFWCRRSLRLRLRAYAAVAVLLALLGGLTLASFAGARRTASAYPRFREAGRALDVQVNAGDFEAEHPDAAKRIPGVTGTATYFGFLAAPVDDQGRPNVDFPGEAAGSFDGLYFTRDRFVVTSGRLPDPSRPHEVAVNEHAARAQGIRPGQRFRIGVFDPAFEEAVYSDSPPQPVDQVEVTVVGVGLFPDEVVQDDTDRFPRVLFTPAFTARQRQYVTYAWTGVEVEGGDAGVDRFKRAYLAALPPGAPASFRERADVTARTQEAVRPLAIALGVFGGLAALATLLLVGQALVRVVRADGDDLFVLRAIGAGPRLVSLVSLPGAAVALAAGVVGAVVVGVALSPFAPIGPLRRVEPDRGIALDWTVLGVGAAFFGLALGAVCLVAAVRQAPHRRQARTRLGVARRSRLAGAFAGAGLPLPAVAGIRMALESGAGRTAVPTRAAIGGAVVAVVALVAALVFGTSLRALVDRPPLYGWDWDLTVLDESGYGDIDVAKAGEVLDADAGVAAWSGVYFQSVDLDGLDVPVIGTVAGPPVAPPLLEGREIRSPGEVVLGRSTLETLGKEVGDTVVLAPGERDQPLRVVGVAVFPTIGPVLGSYTSLGDGALLTYDQIPGWDEISSGPKALFVRFDDDADHDATRTRLQDTLAGVGVFPGSAQPLPVQRPAEIVNYESMGTAPALLAGVLVLAAVVSLGLALASGVGRRRRDLSLLKALGFSRRQVSATVVWQASLIVATGLVVGVPLGIALGRWLWILFAERLPVVAQPSIPVLLLAGVGGALLILGNVVSAVPARVAGSTPVATILRSE